MVIHGINIEGNSIDELLIRSVHAVRTQGHEVGTRQGSMSQEILGPTIYWFNPLDRWLTNPERKHNIFAQLAEVVWILAGFNDTEYLSRFLPRANDFSDDQKTWRAGYGPRLRTWETVNPNHGGAMYTDQLKLIVDELKNNQGTRQAVLSIWDPGSDPKMFGKTKDIPCNNWIHFIVRDEQLHMYISIRSNDVIWGFTGINLVEWSILQELVARMIGVEVGIMKYMPTSFHIYEAHYDRMDAILDSNYARPVDVEDYYKFENISLEDLDILCNHIYSFEKIIRDGFEPSDRDMDSYLALASKYPNIVGTLSIPLIYKRKSDESVEVFLNIVKRAQLHPNLRETLVAKEYLVD